MTKRTSPYDCPLLALSLALGGCGFFQPAPAAEESPTDEVVVTDGEARARVRPSGGRGLAHRAHDERLRLRDRGAPRRTLPPRSSRPSSRTRASKSFRATIELSFDPIAGAQAYEVRLTTDEQTIVLRSLDLAGIAELSVLYEGGIGYVSSWTRRPSRRWTRTTPPCRRSRRTREHGHPRHGDPARPGGVRRGVGGFVT